MESCTNDKHKGHKTVNVYIQNKSIIHHGHSKTKATVRICCK